MIRPCDWAALNWTLVEAIILRSGHFEHEEHNVSNLHLNATGVYLLGCDWIELANKEHV